MDHPAIKRSIHRIILAYPNLLSRVLVTLVEPLPELDVQRAKDRFQARVLPEMWSEPQEPGLEVAAVQEVLDPLRLHQLMKLPVPDEGRSIPGQVTFVLPLNRPESVNIQLLQ